MTAALEVGQRVVAVEHDDHNGGARKQDGRQFAATVTALAGSYVQVRYDDPSVNKGRADAYWADSLWRAWDGALSWRLEAAR